MAARDGAAGIDAQPGEHVTAEALDQRQAFANLACGRQLGPDWSLGKRVQNLLDQSEALLDLANAHPNARVDVALVENRHVERQPVVRRIARRSAHIDGAARRAADIAAGAELPDKLRLENPGRDG